MDRIVVVEDEELVADFIEMALDTDSYELEFHESVESARESLSQTELPSLILLDKQLPGVDGFVFLEELKQDPKYKDLPIIIQTSTDDPASIQQGIELGAYYYLTKPLERELLQTVVREAISHYKEIQELQTSLIEHQAVFRNAVSARFRFKTLGDARMMAKALANYFPDPDRAITGLLELLVNAVEHGNLGITYQEKTDLLTSACWDTEVERRLSLPEYQDRYVQVDVSLSDDQVELIVEDQGDGFNWEKYLDFDPERAFDPHGRGIAMAKMMSFDLLEYQGKGNRVLTRAMR